MRLSIHIKLDEKVLSKYTPNPIYEYAELIEVFRKYGFVHRTPMDIGFINNDAPKELAQKAITDAIENIGWLQMEGLITDFSVMEIGETKDVTHWLKHTEKAEK